MKMKPFVFKDKYSNIEKLYKYARHKFPKERNRIEYDEWSQFVYFRKSKDVHYFYYVKNTDLYFTVYTKTVMRKDLKIITDFKQKVYTDINLTSIFDKILKPLAR